MADIGASTQDDLDSKETDDMADAKKDDKWMQSATKPSTKGALHKELGVKMGTKIPANKLQKAANSSNPLLAKRARLAETFKKFAPKKNPMKKG